ncbi:hypothetical protein LY28_03169 [Ruminiclostridium sufflavum DSM 19573]|uniref:Thioredoxin n=1 Tax=Ruminiclostridium sufflavum DSM 19573 TaxID=1121337 RepID=A0A318XH42_9FIRM|nr:hypothetical protein [Ruminiclostridium sufflavum]PYG85749.1 hypothetical protein LY28_03169 [Ruminiclostridium sufflavum DSM 19573]
MISKKILNKEQAMYAVKNKEFEKSVISSKSKVIVILTQDWCPQWIYMKSWVSGLEIEEDIEIYELEYNKVDYCSEFMAFKESCWKNYNVPYLRFYKEGELARETNYISKESLIEIIDAL